MRHDLRTNIGPYIFGFLGIVTLLNKSYPLWVSISLIAIMGVVAIIDIIKLIKMLMRRIA